MIVGAVNGRLEAVVEVSVSGPDGRAGEVEAVIDTGFSEFLTLPPALVEELRLPRAGEMSALLADGTKADFGVFDATVHWDDRPRGVAVAAADTKPLVGMSLLAGHSLFVAVHDGGRVLVEADEQHEAAAN